MSEVRATRSVSLPLADVWAFVEDLDRWAPLVRGYVAHEQHDARVSTWTLTGELGPFSRQVRCRVTITEWVAPTRVAFTLEGLDEPVEARGAFELSEERPRLPARPPRPWWYRLLDWLTRTVRPAPAPRVGPARSHVVFTFAVQARGPMAPMIDALLGPWSEQVAEQLLADVAARLEHPAARASA